ncbi:MAG: hypothetical protein ACM3VS_06140 [Candidatus Dadabacteria bacterium]
MAELHVQTKKHNSSSLWIWILVALLVIAAVVYFLTRNKNNTTTENTTQNPTTSVDWQQQPLSTSIYVMQAA